MTLDARLLRLLRDVAITVAVLASGVVAISAISGKAYAGLPLARPGERATQQQAAVASPHGAEPACAACHRSHSAPETALLVAADVDNAVCTRCHNAAGERPVSTHANLDYAYAAQAPFTTTCTLCHDPHADPGSGNVAMVRSSIGGHAVSFAAGSGADSYDDGFGDAQHESICVVCHATTSHNNVFSTELIGEGHGPVGAECTSCHPHGGDPAARAGFMPNATATPTATETMPATPAATETATALPAPTDTPPPPTATSEPAVTSVPSPEPTPTDTPEPPSPTPTATETPPP